MGTSMADAAGDRTAEDRIMEDRTLLLLKRFNWFKKYDFEKMAGVVGLLRNVVDGLAAGSLPAEDRPGGRYGSPELQALAESLVAKQRTEPGLEGSWAVCPDRENLPGDEEMDFILFPTCEGAGVLARLLLDQPETAARVDGLEKALAAGLDFLGREGLEGYGADGLAQKVEALLILKSGAVGEYLEKNPEKAPGLREILSREGRRMAEALDAGETRAPWGQDFSAEYRELTAVFLKPILWGRRYY